MKWTQPKKIAKRNRPWPYLIDAKGEPILILICETPFTPAIAKSGKHGQITMKARKVDSAGPRWRLLKASAATLADAKKLASDFAANNPEYFVA